MQFLSPEMRHLSTLNPALVLNMKKGCFKLIATAILLLAVVIQFTGCQVSNPQTRAQKHPELFERLSAADRELVLKGTISEGMTRDAVFLAWGKPDVVTSGSESGRPVEIWRYATFRAVYGGFGYGMGYGYYHPGPYLYPGVTWPLTPGYVPVTSSIVRFRKGRVVSWELTGN